MLSNKQTSTTRHIVEKTIIFLCAVGAVSGLFCQSQALNQAYGENKVLRRYAREAQKAALGVTPNTIDNFVYCNDTNCMTCRAVRDGNERALKEYNAALNTLNIQPHVLDMLRQGPNIQ